MEIGGLDNPIIREPSTNMPYIPGSSLKGKMRALSEWYLDEIPANGDPTRARPGKRTARTFGISAQKGTDIGPTRLVVRDARLSEQSEKDFKEGQPLTEVKSENSINRLTAMANPRPMERVVPGVTFDFEIVYKVLDDGDGGQQDEENYNKVVLVALALVQADFLGSSGSRGCGQVDFINLQNAKGETIELPTITDVTSRAAG
jgi:CRISPR-associated protein Csm3